MAEKSALIIGASRGIGLGLAEELARRGYQVVASERSESTALHEAANRSESKIEIVTCDVTEPDSYSALRDRIDAGSLDLMIVNAGVYGPDDQTLGALTRDDVADIMMTNAVGPVQAAATLLPLVRQGGTIGMMSSKMGSIDDSSGGTNLYRLSKVAQNMLSRSLFERHAKERGVGVISLHPGWVQTEMGGPNALITVATSVNGMLDLLEAESEPRHAFLAYDGSKVAW